MIGSILLSNVLILSIKELLAGFVFARNLDNSSKSLIVAHLLSV